MSTDLALSKADEKRLQKQLEIIDNASLGLVTSIVDIGNALMEIREVVDGSFVEWVESNCGFGKSTAYRYIEAAQVFGTFPKIGNFQDSALYLLCKCDQAAAEAKALANRGKRITHKVAEELVRSVKEREQFDNAQTVDEVPSRKEPQGERSVETTGAVSAVTGTATTYYCPDCERPIPECGTVCECGYSCEGDDDASDDESDTAAPEVTSRAKPAKAEAVEPNTIGYFRNQINDALEGIERHPAHVRLAVAEYLREQADLISK